MRYQFTLVIGAALLCALPGSGCKRQASSQATDQVGSNSSGRITMDQLQGKAKDLGGAVSQYSPQKAQEFMSSANEQMTKLKEQTAALKTTLAQQADSVKAQLQPKLDELEGKINAAVSAAHQFLAAPDQEKEKAKQDFQDAISSATQKTQEIRDALGTQEQTTPKEQAPKEPTTE